MYTTATIKDGTNENKDTSYLGFDVVSEKLVDKYNTFYRKIHSIPNLGTISFDHDTANDMDIVMIYESQVTGLDVETSTLNLDKQDSTKVQIKKDFFKELYNEKTQKEILKYFKNDPSDSEYYLFKRGTKKKILDLVFKRMMTYSTSTRVVDGIIYTDVQVHNMTAEEYTKNADYKLEYYQQKTYETLKWIKSQDEFKDSTFANLDYYNSVALDGTYGGSNSIDGFGVDPGTFSGSNQAKIYKNLIAAGLTKAGAAGIIGKLMAESSCTPLSGGTGGSAGIAQWNGGRLKKLKQKDNWQSVEVQASYIVEELKTGKWKTSTGVNMYTFLCTTKDVDAAVSEVQWKYEVGAWGNVPSEHEGPNATAVYYKGNLKRNLVTHGQEYYDSHKPGTINKTRNRAQANYDFHRGNWSIDFYKRWYNAWKYYYHFKSLSKKEIMEEAEGGITFDGNASEVAKKAISWAMSHTQANGGYHYNYGSGHNGRHKLVGKYLDCSAYAFHSYYDSCGLDISDGGCYSAALLYRHLRRKGCEVSKSQLQPGDLVFTSSLGHVEIYVGNGITYGAHTAKRATNQVGPGKVGGFSLYARPSLLLKDKKK